MPKMRAAQVVSAKGPFQIVERDMPGAGRGTGAHSCPGLRRLPQRFADQGGAVARASSIRVSPDTRSPGSSMCVGVGRGPAGASGDRVGVGWHGGHCGQVRQLPSRRLRGVPGRRPHPRHFVRWRPRGLRGCSRGGPGPHSGGPQRRRGRAADVRRRHDLQLAAACGSGSREISWPCSASAAWASSGRAVRGQGRLPDRCDCTGQGQGSAGAPARRAPLRRHRITGSGGSADAPRRGAGHPGHGHPAARR